MFLNRKIILLICSLAVIGLFFPVGFLNASNTINYQGRLLEQATGYPVADSSYSLQFTFYDQATGGNNLWTETRSVSTYNGLFSVMLGASTTLDGVDFSQDIWLGVKVGADSEMTPRRILGTVPKAFEAEHLGGLTADDFLKLGTTTASTTESLISIYQEGVGDILRLYGTSSEPLVTVNAEGRMSIGTTTAQEMLNIEGNILVHGDARLIGPLIVGDGTSDDQALITVNVDPVKYSAGLPNWFWSENFAGSGVGGFAFKVPTTTAYMGVFGDSEVGIFAASDDPDNGISSLVLYAGDNSDISTSSLWVISKWGDSFSSSNALTERYIDHRVTSTEFMTQMVSPDGQRGFWVNNGDYRERDPEDLRLAILDNYVFNSTLSVGGMGNMDNDKLKVYGTSTMRNIFPDQDAYYNLGSSTKRWGDIYTNGFQGTQGSFQNLFVSDQIYVSDIYPFPGATSTLFHSNILPGTTTTYNLGSSDYRWKDIWTEAINIGTSTWRMTTSGDGSLSFSDSSTSTELFSLSTEGNMLVSGTNTAQNFVSTGWNSRFGTTNQYWQVEELNLGGTGIFPILTAYSDSTVLGNVGAIANNMIIFDKANLGEVALFFSANNLSAIGRLKYDSGDNKFIFTEDNTNSTNVKIIGTLDIQETGNYSTLGFIGDTYEAYAYLDHSDGKFYFNGATSFNFDNDLIVSGAGTSTFAGDLTVTGDAYVQSLTETSDFLLKTNIEDLGYGLEDIMKLRPVSFDFLSNDRQNIGFIAQEVKDIIPEVVSGHEGSYGIRYSVLTALLTKGIQEMDYSIFEEEKETSTLGRFGTSVKEVLNKLGLSVKDGIVRAKEFISDKITTKQLCLKGDDGEVICIDKSDLKGLLQDSGQTYYSSPSSGESTEGEGESTEGEPVEGEEVINSDNT